MSLDRNNILGALYSLGILLPVKSNLSDEDLKLRLRQALDDAQVLEEYFPNFTFNPSNTRRWETVGHQKLEVAYERGLESLEEFGVVQDVPVTSLLSAFKTSLAELVQTLTEIAKNVSKGQKVVIIQDQYQKSCVVLRVRPCNPV